MKNRFTPISRTALFLSMLCLSLNSAQAAIFTAIASGNFSSSTTWTGGLVPPISLSGDDIIIPIGFTVTMDRDVALESASSLTVNGSLTGASGKFLSMTTAALNGNGSITVDSFSAGFTTGFNFTGSLDADAFHSSNAMINASSATTILIKTMLHLSGGTMTLAQGTLNLSPNATIVVNGGIMTVTGGTANLATVYHVLYLDSATSGVELTGSGLANVAIVIPSASKVILSGDLSLNGTLTLMSGYLDLNGHDLTFDLMSDLAATGTGSIISAPASSIYINAKNGLTGKLQFDKTAIPPHKLHNFSVNTDSGKKVAIAWPGDLQITGNVYLVNGLFDITGGDIHMKDTAKIIGGGQSSYFITSHNPISAGDYRSVRMFIEPDSTRLFHIGTPLYYAPCIIKNGTGSQTAEFFVAVSSGVKDLGGHGASVSATQPVVDATWNIFPQGGPNVNVDITLMWDASMELNSFDRSIAYISHFSGGVMTGYWDTLVGTAASLNSNGMYNITRSGITSLGTLAVFDNNTKVSVNDINIVSDVQVYPNPAADAINIIYNTKDNKEIKAEIFNVTGQLMQSNPVSNGHATINISILPKGMYYIRLDGEGGAATQKFVKQ